MKWYETLRDAGHSFTCLDDRTGEKIEGPELDYVYSMFENPEGEGEAEGIPDHVTMVDAQTRNAMLKVHDALSKEKREQFRNMRPSLAATVAWKAVGLSNKIGT